MNYDKVFEGLKQGKAYARKAWKGYQYIITQGRIITKIEANTNNYISSYNPTLAELEATDWREFADNIVKAVIDEEVRNVDIIPSRDYINENPKGTWLDKDGAWSEIPFSDEEMKDFKRKRKEGRLHEFRRHTKNADGGEPRVRNYSDGYIGGKAE
ncbi:MAG: DUF2829 domain-containing protein [Treponema sp.]|jgi:hypothetical protein|nr:DUF2829 domain-containing protein [Treponema sp.]